MREVKIPDPITATPQSDQRCAVAFDALQLIAHAVICTDEDGQILLFNCAAEQGFSCNASEVIGQHAQILLPESDRVQHTL